MAEKMSDQAVDGSDENGAATDNYSLDCGWGRVVFGQTFDSPEELTGALREEKPDCRDIAIYVQDPHVLLASAPQEIFLDPSHTYRLDLRGYEPSGRDPQGFFIRRLTSRDDAVQINRIYASRGMVQVAPDFFWSKRDARALIYFVAEDERTGEIVGTVTGVDHARAFNDPEKGSSLWCLAVDPQAAHRGIGEMLVRRLAEYFIARGTHFMDLSVLHDNEFAIGLYEKLGFERVSLFTVKRKNVFNEKLFTGPEITEKMNPYAEIIVNEARRRGIQVDILDAEGGFFRLTQGGVTVRCREALSEHTTAVAMSICDDKSVTRRIVERAGVVVPKQIGANASSEDLGAFLKAHGRVVVKPARGEQGRGISIGLSDMEGLKSAIDEARQVADEVLIEEMVEGQDLRLVVINFKVVAAAIRRPPVVIGDGESTIEKLIEAQSRRRMAATGGESSIPVDAETERTLEAKGKSLSTVLAEGEEVTVRKAANLHTGGTIHDVTEIVHPNLVQAAIDAAKAIDIPVVGIDFMVKSPAADQYAFIEANERPGLANHEPQPTAERFVDLLFPLSMPATVRRLRQNNEQKTGRQDVTSDD